MSTLRRVLGLRSEERSMGDWARDITVSLAPRTASGKDVTPESALQVSAVYGSIRILAETISTLPAGAYIRNGGARYWYPAPEWLEKPAAHLGRIELLSQAMVSSLLAGNAYIATTRQGGRIVSAIPLDPHMVTPERVDGRIIFHAAGQIYGPQDILHIPGLMLPGSIVGVSPISYARESIGLSLAAQEYGAAFFGNSGVPSAVVEVPGPLTETGKAQLKAAWNDLHKGSSNAARLGVLTEGAKLTKVTLAPDEAQFLQTRAFQVPDIARIFGVPPHLLADASGSTSWGSGLAEQNVAFAQHSLRPWVERLEAGLTRLFQSAEASGTSAFIKLNMAGLERGSLETRMATYSIGLQQGIYNLDEVRAFEDLPPIANNNGKTHRIPLNLGEVGAVPVPPSTPPGAKP